MARSVISAIDSSRTEMLTEARAKQAVALRAAQIGKVDEQEYWLGVAGRLNQWIGLLEKQMHTGDPGTPRKT